METVKGRDNLKDLDKDGRNILRQVLKKQDYRAWNTLF
jgi:hypothetical protein